MKVSISVLGRAHLFNLAHQLHQRDALERIYSGFTWSALKREGLPRQRVTTLPFVRPFMMLKYPRAVQPGPAMFNRIHGLSAVTQDAIISRHLPPSDIFVAAEGLGLRSGPRAKARGARYVLDRGCTHLGWQTRLLAEEHDRLGLSRHFLPTATYHREIAEYDLADLIVVPSQLARQTFLAEGIPAQRIAVVPYGVRLDQFTGPRELDATRFDILFVGKLSVRKGAHDLLAALDLLGPEARLTIAGPVSPVISAALGHRLAAPNVRLLGRVPHQQLKSIMTRSHVLVLPSVEDGFGLVVPEAMACGCPVVISENTGAKEHITHGVEGFIVPIRAPEAIANALITIRDSSDRGAAMGEAARQRMQGLGGWDRYGELMMSNFTQLLAS